MELLEICNTFVKVLLKADKVHWEIFWLQILFSFFFWEVREHLRKRKFFTFLPQPVWCPLNLDLVPNFINQDNYRFLITSRYYFYMCLSLSCLMSMIAQMFLVLLLFTYVRKYENMTQYVVFPQGFRKLWVLRN